MQKAKLLKDTTSYMGTTYLVQLLSFVRGIIVARLLGPVLYGYFSGLGLLLLYNPYAQLGVLQGMFREMSIKRGSGCTDNMDSLRDNAFTFVLMVAILVVGIVLTYSVVYADKLGREITWGLRAFAVVCLFNHQEMLYHDLLRLEHRFWEVNVSRLIFSIFNIILSIGLIFIWGFYGILLALLVAMACMNLYLMFRGRYDFKITLDKRVLWRFVKTGIPISFCFLTVIIMCSIDRLMILRFLNVKQLGFYSVAIAFSMLLFKASETISYVMQPTIFEQYGKTNGERKSLVNVYEKSTMVLSTGIGLLTGIFIIIIEPTICYMLPKYRNAVDVCEIVVFGVFFFSVNQIALRVIIAIGCFRDLVIIQIVIIAVNVFLNYVAIYNGFGINGIAVATSISYFLYSTTIIQYLYYQFKVGLDKSVINNLGIYMPVVFSGIIGYSLSKIEVFAFFAGKGLFSQILMCSIEILLLLVCYLPFFVILERKTGFLVIVKQVVLNQVMMERS